MLCPRPGDLDNGQSLSIDKNDELIGHHVVGGILNFLEMGREESLCTDLLDAKWSLYGGLVLKARAECADPILGE